MRKKLLFKFSEYFLLFFLAFAPWYDNVVLLPQIKLSNPFFSPLTNTGLANLTLVLFCIAALLPLLLMSYSRKPMQLQDGLILLWPVLNILNFKYFDGPGVVALYNSFFLAICGLCLLRHADLFEGFGELPRKGFVVFLISYSLAVFLPLLIEIDSAPSFIFFGDVERYRGWSGIGPLSFCGFTVGTWGLMNFLADRHLTRNQKLLNVYAMMLGVLGVSLTVLRIGWAALLVVFVYGLGLCFLRSRKKDAFLLIIALAFTIGSFYSSKLSRKGVKNFHIFSAVFEVDLISIVKNLSVSKIKTEQAVVATGAIKPVSKESVPAVKSAPKLLASAKPALASVSQKPAALPPPPAPAAVQIPVEPAPVKPATIKKETKPVLKESVPAIVVPVAPAIASQEPVAPPPPPKPATIQKETKPALKESVPVVAVPVAPAIISQEPVAPPPPAPAAVQIPVEPAPVKPQPVGAPMTATPLDSKSKKEQLSHSVVSQADSVNAKKIVNPTAEPSQTGGSEYKVPAKEESIRTYLWRFDGFSNGRIGILYTLGPQFIQHPLFGVGTGGAGRYLRKNQYATLEAHNEYLRILVEHGIVGGMIFSSVLISFIFIFRQSAILAAFYGMAVLMVTDNYLIYPCFGYGPIFLAMCIVGFKEQLRRR